MNTRINTAAIQPPRAVKSGHAPKADLCEASMGLVPTSIAEQCIVDMCEFVHAGEDDAERLTRAKAALYTFRLLRNQLPVAATVERTKLSEAVFKVSLKIHSYEMGQTTVHKESPALRIRDNSLQLIRRMVDSVPDFHPEPLVAR